MPVEETQTGLLVVGPFQNSGSRIEASPLPLTLSPASSSLSIESMSNSPAGVINGLDTQPTDQRASAADVPNQLHVAGHDKLKPSTTSSPTPELQEPLSILQLNEVQTPPKVCNCLWEQVVLKLSAEEQELCKENLKLAPLLDVNPTDGVSMLTPANLQVPTACSSSEGPTGVILDKLIAEAHRKRQECEDNRWKILIRGREIIFRSVIDKIVDFANKFRDIGTIATSYDPVHSALPWAAFVVLLQVRTGSGNSRRVPSRARIW